jgi:oligopeptide/dipeptide ABC transporter ATP-binding protein
MTQSVVSVKNLEVSFSTESGMVNAVRDLSFELREQEVLGIVGESGSGKSVTSLALIGLLPKSAVVSGSVQIDGEEIVGRKEKEMYKLRGSKVSMIFQDPMTSLNPVYTIGWQIIEAVRAHGDMTKEQAKVRAIELLRLSGIPRPDVAMESYPHEFSGGMRQRAVIAIAMANQPRVMLADEPTTALDVTVQAQVLQSLQAALEATKSALVLVTHDLGVVAGVANRVIVMYAGRVVEFADVDDLFYQPSMPYTHGLLGSIPSHTADSTERLSQIPGSPPTMINHTGGCPFAPRCPLAQDICRTTEPALEQVLSNKGAVHLSACHFRDEVAAMPIASMFSGRVETLEGVEDSGN